MASKDIEEEYERVRNELLKEENGDYNRAYIKRQLNEKENLRRVFLAVAKHKTSRISQIFEEAILTKQTCYNLLHTLLKLNLVSRIYVSQVVHGAIKNDEIKNDFEDWTSKMPEHLKRYYLSKTSYWVLTDIGKEVVPMAFEFDKRYKEKKKKIEKKKNG